MQGYTRDEWIQAFCLHLAIADPMAYDGALLQLAREQWEKSEALGLDPADAVQQLLLDRVLQQRPGRRGPGR